MMNIDMEDEIHLLEQEAYCAVLRAFKAQSDAITWEKEGLITELRKELRVSDDEHRELLSKVHADDLIQRIRNWRQGGGHQTARHGGSFLPGHDVLPSPSVSASRKKQRTSQLHSQPPGLSSVKSMHYASTGAVGSRSFTNRITSNANLANDDPEDYVGRKVWTRWPEDNNFYEAFITQYNVDDGRHALVYDISTENETWEWVDIKDIPQEDIRWPDEDSGISFRPGPGRGVKKAFNHGPPVSGGGRGRGPSKRQLPREIRPLHNGTGNRFSDDIELANTETLVKEVEKVFNTIHPDPVELEKAKKMLKEQEQALVDAIARLADASDGESDGEQQYSQMGQ